MKIALTLNSKAISPLIAMVFTILFGVIMLALVLNIVNPVFRRAQDTSVVTDALQNLEMLNTAVNGVASEAQGSKRTVSLSVMDGFYRTNSTYDWLYFEYDPQEDIRLTGTKGSVEIERGLEFEDYFNYYVDGSKAAPVWTNISGQWTASDYKYSGMNGTSYHNVSGPLENWKFSASISNVSGTTGGQVFALPTNPESLVMFLPFDNRSGSVAYDYSGNRNNGTLTNMSTTGNSTSGWQNASSCKAGRSCLKFDGVGDYVNVSDSTSLRVAPPFTVSFWMYLGDVGQWTAFNKGNPGDNNNWYIYGEDNWDPRATYWFDGSRYDAYPSGMMNFLNTWRHVVVVYPMAGNPILFYADGSLLETGDNMPVGVSSNTEPLKIGQYGSSGGYDFEGNIDEVMIFNRSLSAGEVAALYETSANKLDATGTQTITAKTNVSIVLSNPAGRTKFDDVKVTRDRSKLTLSIPYDGIDINGTLRVGKGEHQIEIRHMGTNTTSNRPIIQILPT